MLQLRSLKSSSRGNAVLVSYQNAGVLIDCGISGKAAEAAILEAGLSPAAIKAILVTHEHLDHIRGVGILARRLGIPVYANDKTWAAMESSIGNLCEAQKCTFCHADAFSVDDFVMQPFPIPHDAADPVGYSVSVGDKKVSVATDMGVLEESVFRALKGSGAVLLESNHDLSMLSMGPYPPQLKQRIRSDRGHLSNDDAAKATEFLVKMGTEQILLGHLSPENNNPYLAEETVACALRMAGIKPGSDMRLFVAPKDQISACLAV